jgi:hypothetical protein
MKDFLDVSIALCWVIPRPSPVATLAGVPETAPVAFLAPPRPEGRHIPKKWLALVPASGHNSLIWLDAGDRSQ